MSDLYKNVCLCCDYCQAKFKDTSRLNRHIKTSKKCLSDRVSKKINCVWCNEEFISNIYLEKHSTKCKVNKEQKYIDLITKHNSMLEEKDKMIEEKDKMIKDFWPKNFIHTHFWNNFYP